MDVVPFRIDVSEAELGDLRRRLAATRWPDQIPGSGWMYGADLGYLRELVAYWLERFDWRAQERRLNAFAHFKAVIDGLGIHFIHQRGEGERPLPLLLMHGWPSSVSEMVDVIGPLCEPSRYGGDARDAFDVIAPSLPGYGFSDPPAEPGVAVIRMAELFARLLVEGLGYSSFAAAGGDWGAAIATRLGYTHPERVVGIHLTSGFAGRIRANEPEQSEAERAYFEAMRVFRRDETGFAEIQSTKPQTLGYGLVDSPVGLAAWIIEKFHGWSDCGGDLESRFTKDELLTNVMIYWVTRSASSAGRSYYEERHALPAIPRGGRVRVPTGVAAFAGPIPVPPREAVARGYALERWTRMPSGGHFPALEEAEALVGEIRSFFRPLRERAGAELGSPGVLEVP